MRDIEGADRKVLQSGQWVGIHRAQKSLNVKSWGLLELLKPEVLRVWVGYPRLQGR
jgi:hypothetical protein